MMCTCRRDYVLWQFPSRPLCSRNPQPDIVGYLFDSILLNTFSSLPSCEIFQAPSFFKLYIVGFLLNIGPSSRVFKVLRHWYAIF